MQTVIYSLCGHLLLNLYHQKNISRALLFFWWSDLPGRWKLEAPPPPPLITISTYSQLKFWTPFHLEKIKSLSALSEDTHKKKWFFSGRTTKVLPSLHQGFFFACLHLIHPSQNNGHQRGTNARARFNAKSASKTFLLETSRKKTADWAFANFATYLLNTSECFWFLYQNTSRNLLNQHNNQK